MENISKQSEPLPERDIFYFRQRQKNRVFSDMVAFFADEAELTGITKRDIANRIRRDPAQITKWLSEPKNLTLDTISDLLLALGAEMDYRIVRFKERAKPNAVHPLLEQHFDQITSVKVGDISDQIMPDVSESVVLSPETATPEHKVTVSLELE